MSYLGGGVAALPVKRRGEQRPLLTGGWRDHRRRALEVEDTVTTLFGRKAQSTTREEREKEGERRGRRNPKANMQLGYRVERNGSENARAERLLQI